MLKMPRLLWMVGLAMVLIALFPTASFAASNDIKVTINGKQLYFDVNPQSIDGRTFVPMRGIFEALGADIKWDGKTQTVTGSKGETTVKLTINQKQAYINGKTVNLDAPATIVKGSTLVPVRFIAESLGADVKWDASTSTVIILQGEVTASDYYYFLYNSKSVSASDLMAIKSYIGKFRSSNNILMDVTEAKDAVEIYKRLQSDSTLQSGKLLGIQIFGASEDVPAFNYLSKTATIFPDRSMSRFDLVLNGEPFLTDYFYSNFNNDSAQLKKEISPYAVFDEKTVKIDFEPQWKVVRLPLSKGEIEGYFKRFNEYTTKRNAQKSIPVVNFSSPTYGNIPGTPEDGEDFRDPNDERRLLYQKDDYSYVLQRLDKEFNILKNYRLYGNQQGDIKVKTNVSGDYTKDNVAKENGTGIVDFIFNGAGNFTKTKFKVVERGDEAPSIGSDSSEKIMTPDTVNKVLSKNYYTMIMMQPEDAKNLSNKSLVHEMMANGKAISVFAGSNKLLPGGLNNIASLEDMKPTLYYFTYNFYKNQSEGLNRTDSYFNASRAFVTELLNHQDLKWDPNFEFGITNITSLHSLGVIEYN
ncbi:hypothetical protein A8L34_11990 [Bacillus sp. FJAT-27264]|uniref:copper amine oxidase N-terminal domain-containing protein n=1 Tax=Paenibacillus sp. (strain DSM 101736 / FJAT-27264) TaxID=1850362 RepID=UPI000807ACDA|nr:copper amine oxidase N-terminal domain-containing protein [Bacillus sp. FJAT-27264]OBZ14635.1 hypothetical protein A8L34_11990 [Bacillus sp. FJAT-27264]